MADETMYSWSNIRTADSEGNVSVIPPGDEVDAGKLGVDDDNFQAFVDSGAVRPMEFPDLPENYDQSPIRFLRDMATQVEDALVTGKAAGVNEQLLQRTMSGRLPLPEEEETVEATATSTKSSSKSSSSSDETVNL